MQSYFIFARMLQRDGGPLFKEMGRYIILEVIIVLITVIRVVTTVIIIVIRVVIIVLIIAIRVGITVIIIVIRTAG